MDPIEAKKRKLEERAARRRAKLSEAEPGGAPTSPPAPPSPSPAPGAPPPQSAPKLAAGAPGPTPATPAGPPATAAAAATSEPEASSPGLQGPAIVVGVVFVLALLIGGLASLGDPDAKPGDAGGTPSAPEDPAADPAEGEPAASAPGAVDSSVAAPVDSEAVAAAEPSPVDPTPAEPVAEVPAEPPPLDPQPEASIEALTVALEEAAADDPALEARRDALLQAIAGLEVQGRALTALELQWIARARRALGEGPPAEPVQPEPPEPVALELAVHEPPSGLEAHSETPGSIRVAWSAGALSSGVVVERFAVERSVDGGAWAEVGSIAAVGSTEFEDTQVHDWSEYRYRVASLAALDSSAQGISLPDALRRQASEEVGPLRAVRRLYVVPVTVEPEKSAYIRVYGWDTEEAKFESKCFQVELGETIGAAIKRNARELNLATGAVLLASESGERKHPTQDFMQRYSAITVKWPDGTEEVVTDHDTPEAVQEDK